MRLSLLVALCLPALLAQAPYTTITLAGKLPTAEGEPAKEAVLRRLQAISASPDGDIFFSESAPNRIRQLKEDGTLRTISERPSTFLAAGRGVLYFGTTVSLESWRDGALTLLAPASGSPIRPRIVGLTTHFGLAHISENSTKSVLTSVGPGAFTPVATRGVALPGLLRYRDSGLYIVDGGRQVRKSDGTLIAGNGLPGTPIDGALAAKSPLGLITQLAVSPEGEVAMANPTDNQLLITRVDQDGLLRIWYDSARPSATIRSIAGIEYAPNGGLYVLDVTARRILLLHRSGEIEPTAGRVPFAGDGEPAVDGLLNSPT